MLARLLSLAACLLFAVSCPAGEPDPGRKVLGCDRGRVAIVDGMGKVELSLPLKFGGAHDVWLLESGNLLLHTGPATVEEVTAAGKSVWKYTAKPREPKGRVEIHAFQRLADGVTMVAESGNRRIVEVDRKGKIVREVPLQVDHPDPHRDTRLARKLESGNYLVCHEGDGCVREYDAEGRIVWSYALELGDRPRSPGHGPEGHGVEVFSAVRLKSGNTLIGGGNNNRVLEVDRKGKIVWSVDQKELPGVTLAWVTTLHVLPSGNVIIGNTHAGAGQPQLIEVNRDKKVVWRFEDHRNFGNDLAAVHVLGLPKGTLR